MTKAQIALVDLIAEKAEAIVSIEKTIAEARLELQSTLNFDDEHKYEAKAVFRYMEQKGIR